MTLLAQLGSLSNEAADHDFAMAVSRSLQPHDPHHRHSPTLIDPESGNSGHTTSNLRCRSQRTLRSGHAVQHRLEHLEEEDRSMNEMNKTMNLGELGSDNERASDDSDSELLARYQQYDDEAALAAIHSRHSDDLRAYASRALGAGSRADAEDMVQEAFQSFHKNRKRYSRETPVSASSSFGWSRMPAGCTWRHRDRKRDPFG